MRQEVQKWENMVLSAYQAGMYESLIHVHNITTESSKHYSFEDEHEIELPLQLRGYFAFKDLDGKKSKFFIEEKYYHELPIRVNAYEEIFFRDSGKVRSIVLRPIDITPFRIKPQKVWEDNHKFVDIIAPFQHTHPEYWNLSKIVAMMGYVGKTFCCISSLSEFGKSSIYSIMNAITQKVPVFQPRSVPGVLAQITGDGNMVFDEVHDAPSEVKACMENFSLQVAGSSSIYINGAMRSKNTKAKYDVAQQSITYLYNVFTHYSDPTKQFWDNIWSNTKAMQSRFLRLKFDGRLEEKFDKDFDVIAEAENNRMLYVKIAKHLLYLKQIKLNNSYKRKYQVQSNIHLKGRHKICYDEITWGLDLYSKDQKEFSDYVSLLDKSIHGYKEMIGQETLHHIVPNFDPQTNLEEVRSDKERIIDYLREKKIATVSEIESDLGIKNADELIDKLSKEYAIFEPQRGSWSVLE